MKKNFFLIGLIIIFITACTSMTSNESVKTTGAKSAADSNVELGMSYLQQGDMSRAKQKLLTAVEQEPNSAQAHAAMGYFLDNTGDTRSAETYYKKAIDIDPKAGATHNNYGTYLCRHGRYQEAEQHFMLAVQDSSYLNTASAYENAGLCAMQVHDLTKAAGYFNQAVQHDPKRALSWLELGEINYQQNKYQDAQQYLARYMQLTSDPGPEALWLGVRIARQLGDSTTAGNYTLTLQSKYPNSVEYKQLLATPKPKKSNVKRPLYF